MREIIPIKKDILFKTTIGQITNINLDYDYKVKDSLIEGFLLVNGSYKMTEASVLEDEFSYKIPFGVSISKSIKKDTIKIEIDDFKYQINKDVLSLNIDLLFCCEEESENVEIINNEIKGEAIEDKEETIDNLREDDVKENNLNIASKLNNNEEKYYTYKIYIVRENDTVESICKKYNVTLNDISEYNDLTNLNIGDKIIIPYINE